MSTLLLTGIVFAIGGLGEFSYFGRDSNLNWLIKLRHLTRSSAIRSPPIRRQLELAPRLLDGFLNTPARMI